MKYGYFEDAHREYIITNPKTPYPWINYLGNEDFFSLISNTSGGYTFYKDAKEGKNHSPRLEEWLNSGGAYLCQLAWEQN